ncbi:MAG TPA: PTS sugar transporter subunit IIC [Longimicrobiales bacterium]|nr:PTS sugar transporter subunit IIC [Longimicrobiales bacterium]
MTLLLLSLLGGLVAVDNVSFVQAMISRPLAAGILAGAVLGDPLLGAQVGGILELFLLVAVPAGGGRMPEGGTATVVAVAAATAFPAPSGMALGVAGGLIWGLVGGWTQTRLRVRNGGLAPVPGDGGVPAERVERAVRLGLALDFARGVVLTAVGAGLALILTPYLAPSWPLEEIPTSALLLLGGLVSIGIVLRGAGATRRTVFLFGTGAVLGLLSGWGLA